MKTKPIFIFDALTDTGIDEIPVDALVIVKDADGNNNPIQVVKTSLGTLTETSTIEDFLSTETIFSNIGVSASYQPFLSLTDLTIKTVASNATVDPTSMDFATIEEALVYAEKYNYLSGGILNLILDDGVHFLERNPYSPLINNIETPAYDLTKCSVILNSSSGVRDDCIITLANSITGFDSGLLIGASNGTLGLVNVKIDLAHGGADISKFVSMFKISNSYFYSDNSIINGLDSDKGFCLAIESGSGIKVSNSIIGNFYGGVLALGGATYSFNSNAFNDLTVSFQLVNGMGSFIVNDITHNNVTNEYLYYDEITNTYEAILINEITKFGGLISNSEEPLVMSGWSGPSSNRPTLINGKAYNQSYFDTDLRKPIWWRGNKWVKADGKKA